LRITSLVATSDERIIVEHVGGFTARDPPFDTGLTQDAVTRSPGILLGVNGHPNFFSRCRMLQQPVTVQF
jgi:hypothetical protein